MAASLASSMVVVEVALLSIKPGFQLQPHP